MQTTTAIPAWIRAIVVLNAAVFLLFGAAFMFAPAQLAAAFDIQLTSPDALADLRAMYGGISLAGGALFVTGLRNRGYFMPSLFFTMLSSLGLALGRLYSTAVSGVPGPVIFALLATEVVSFAWAFWGYRVLTRASCAESAFRVPRTA